LILKLDQTAHPEPNSATLLRHLAIVICTM